MDATTQTVRKPAGHAVNTAMPISAALKSRQQACLVVGQLCGRRHDLANRRRGTLRGPRSAGRPESARRCRRQRQCQPGRGAPMVRGHFNGLCAEPAGARSRAGIGRRLDNRIQGGRRRGVCRLTTARFDAVVSTFGVMFTPNQDQAAAELLRVCKSGGQIGLANWTPDGFVGQMFKTLGKYLPPPAGAKSPALWGTRARLNEMFGPASQLHQGRAPRFQFPLSIGGAFYRRLQNLLRSDAQGVRSAR